MEEKEFTIQELIQQSGVSRRNVYFYTQQGILPPPQGAGLAAHYFERHLLRLLALPVYRSQGLRLDQIREELENISLDELRALVADNPQKPSGGVFALPKQAALSIQEEKGTYPLGSRRIVHYDLPGGVELAVPEDLRPEMQEKVVTLLREAGRIFGTGKEGEG